MKLTKSYNFLLLLPFAMYYQIASATVVKQPTDSLTLNYFKEKIADFDKTNSKTLSKGKAIKLNELAQSQQKIWGLWKKANTDLAELPTAEAVTEGKKNYSVHQWKLHDEDPMPFYFVTKGEKPASGYSLFLNLHGSGPKNPEFTNTLAWTTRYKDSPSSYFIPQIPNEKRYRWWFKPVQYAWEKLFRIAMVSGNIDANKIYVMGISEGGYGSQRLGAFYADYLAGAGPMAGGEPLINAAPLNYRHLAFSLQTGENDRGFGRNTLTARAKQVFDSLARVYPGDFNHKIELQAGKGHGIDYTVTTPWLIQYKRTPQPAVINWVLFPMNGRYRNGFYNVAIDKPLNITEGVEFDRALFNLNINKQTNTINIDVVLQDGNGTKTAAVKAGEISIFLSPTLVDLSKKVKVIYKGKVVHNQKPVLSENIIAESCALFGDPERLFPAKIKVVL